MTGILQWLCRGNRFLILTGAMHWVVGLVGLVWQDNQIEGLLVMILGILIIILAKMDDEGE